MKNNTTIVWFRKDLRIHDNPALWEASKHGTVIPVFIWSPEEEIYDQYSEASHWWLYHSLKVLANQLQQLGLSLILRQGASLPILKEIMREANANTLFFNERYEPSIRLRDKKIKDVLTVENIQVKTFHSHTLFEPLAIKNKENQPYKVYTPFLKQCLKMTVPLPLPSPSSFIASNRNLNTLSSDELPLLSNIQWHQKLLPYWKPGETGALNQLNSFVKEKISSYKTKRDDPSLNLTSHLSPHLAWGEISPNTIWHTLMNGQHDYLDEDVEIFIKQLIWREFSYHQLIHVPNSVDLPIRSEFNSFPWQEDEKLFTYWKKGMTGYPLVDAGMRQLWETGWMHNRVRMIAASFLVKHLFIPWVKGAKWFTKTLVDADLANNTMGWQWITGSGVDAAPYFRIFNPVLQGEKFDANGEYIRKWIPELSKMPTKYIHQPWKAPKKISQESDVILGSTYPFPIIDHAFARERALSAYYSIKNKGESTNELFD